MSKGILIFGEVRDGNFKGINRELVTAARSLADAGAGVISMALIGADAPMDEARACGVEKVYTASGPALETYSSQGYATALKGIIEESGASIVLFGATSMGRDLSARAAAKCDASLFTDCTEISLTDGNLSVKRPVYSGKVYREMVSTSAIQMASVRANIFPAAAADGSAEAVTSGVSVDAAGVKGRVTETVSTSTGSKDLTEAEIIVSGGRSLKSAENFDILKGLADTIGGSVGASRAAVDAGYVPHSMQVGQTGKVVNPKLYIACGISGAIQHLVGMRTSKVIVAINKDASAPIFTKADYGIEGDLFDVVPALTEEFKVLLG